MKMTKFLVSKILFTAILFSSSWGFAQTTNVVLNLDVNTLPGLSSQIQSYQNLKVSNTNSVTGWVVSNTSISTGWFTTTLISKSKDTDWGMIEFSVRFVGAIPGVANFVRFTAIKTVLGNPISGLSLPPEVYSDSTIILNLKDLLTTITDNTIAFEFTLNYSDTGEKQPFFISLKVTTASNPPVLTPPVVFDEDDVPNIHNNVIRERDSKVRVSIRVSAAGRITFKVYTMVGEEIGTLLDQDVLSGDVIEAVWNLRNEAGDEVANGLYFIQVVFPNGKKRIPVVLRR